MTSKHNFIWITRSGDGLGHAYRIAKKGHDVHVLFLDPFYKGTYEGILPVHFFRGSQVKGKDDRDTNEIKSRVLLNDIRKIQFKSKEKPCVIFDMTGNSYLAEKVKRAGYPTFGAGMGIGSDGRAFNDVIEEDRKASYQIAEYCGINCGEWHYYPVEECIEFIRESDKDWVIKPLGDYDKSLTFPSKDKEQLISMLEKFNKDYPDNEGVVIQEMIKGTEVSVEVYVSGGKFVKNSISGLLETKRFLAENDGQNVGCMTSVAWFYDKPPDPFNESLAKMEKLIGTTDFCGIIDCNGIVTDDNEYVWLEFTPRIGYSDSFAKFSLFNIDLGEFFYLMASGNMTDLDRSDEFACCISVYVPPAPFEAMKKCPDEYKAIEPTAKKLFGSYENMIDTLVYYQSKGITVEFDPDNDNIIPLDVYYDKEEGKLKTAGKEGLIVDVTNTDKDMKKCIEGAYDLVDDIVLSNKILRRDAYENASKRYKELEEKGYV